MPTGELRLLWWDVDCLSFSRSQHVYAHQVSGFTLMPPCCGKGAVCQHWQSIEHPQWPNGDALDLGALRPIPEAFARLLKNELRQPGWQQQRELETSFKPLLGEHYRPPPKPSHHQESEEEPGDCQLSETGDTDDAESKASGSDAASESSDSVSICEDGPDPEEPHATEMPTLAAENPHDPPSDLSASDTPIATQPAASPPTLVNGHSSCVGLVDPVTGQVQKVDMRRWPGESEVAMLERWIREIQSGPESPFDATHIAQFRRCLEKARVRAAII